MKVELPVMTVRLVNVAASLYISQRIVFAAEQGVRWYTERYAKIINALHADGLENLKTPFDLWWSQGPGLRVDRTIAEKPEIPEHAKEQVSENIRKAALHVAVHTSIDNEELRLISLLPRYKNIRQSAIDRRTQHQRELQDTRNELVKFGVDLDKLEQYFAPSSA